MRLKKSVKQTICIVLAVLMVVMSVQLPKWEIFAGEPAAVDGTTVTTPAAGTSYYFDFQNAASDLYDKGDKAEAAQGDALKTGTFGLMTVDKAGKFHGKDHGMNGAAQLTFQVAGTCKISVGGCQFTGEGDVFKMSAAGGRIIAEEKKSKTAKCYNASNTDGSDRVDFYYVGGAGTVTLVSPGSYIPRIEIIPVEEAFITEKELCSGTAVSEPKAGGTYYFDFQNAASDLYDKGDADAAVEGTLLKTGTFGLMTVNTAGKFHDTTHGMNGKAQLTFKVAGDCTIMIGSCQFSGTATYTMSSSTGTFDEETKDAKTTKCYNTSNTDGSDRVVFTYTGEAGTVTLDSSGGYIARIQIVNADAPAPVEKRPIEVWDFAGSVQETDTTLYHNNITAEAWTESGKIDTSIQSDATNFLPVDTAMEITFGTLTMKIEKGDRLYGPSGIQAAFKSFSKFAYEDGYTANGLWYCNGSANSGRRYVMINDVKAGDKIAAYLGSHTVEVDTLHFLYQGTDGTQDETAEVGNTTCKRYEFIAQYSGSYKIYLEGAANAKPVWHRVMQIPPVEVTGSVDADSLGISGYGVKFVNDTTDAETQAVVKNGSFTAYLIPGYTYTAVLTGVVGYGITDATKTITVDEKNVMSGMSDVTLAVESKNVCQLSGVATGFAAGQDLTKVKVVLQAAEGSQKENVTFKLASDGSYSTYVEKDINYTITLEGANDYEIISNTAVNLSADTAKDIEVAKKPVYTVSGGFLGLTEGAAVTDLKFVNMEDKYSYDAAISGNGYTVDLRNGTYEVKATVPDYQTISHVIVKDNAVARDLLFTTSKVTPIPLVKDIYVGYPDKENNYASVRAAVAACKAMNPASEEDRITVHIAPGTYREQVIVETPYISFVNDNPSEEVKLTWYYGVGYTYYSIGSDGYYSEAAAFDKFSKNTAQKWGSATYIKSKATAFRAENITFEASFNKYMTEEEVADGVEPGGQDIKNFDRTADADVASSEATERAAALAVEGNQSEFYNCKIVSSQDTLYTGNNVKAYFKNCYIDGNTDYIFGGGDFVFDACELQFYGYSNAQKGAYLTAAADGSTTGYIFRNCYVSTNSAWEVASSFFGRPWRASATVAFINTKLQTDTIIQPVGWNAMGDASPENANYKEYNTTVLGGGAVDTSKRTAGTVQSSNPFADITAAFGDWTPYYYTAEDGTAALAAAPVIEGKTQVGEVLKADFSLGDNEGADASTIKWYRVTKAGTETLVKTSLAYLDRTYTVTEADNDCYMKVVVKPETISGVVGTEQSVQTEKAIGEKEEAKADYTAVDEAIAAADALTAADYVDFTGVTEAIAAVIRDLPESKQAEVDAMAKAINDAIAALVKKPADYSAVEAAIQAAEALGKTDYVDFTGVDAAIAAVVRDLTIDQQAEVDAMAEAINNAVKALVKKSADYSAVDAAIAAAGALTKTDYVDFTGVDAAIAAVVRDLTIDQQAEVDAMAKAINDAVAALVKKPTTPDEPDTPDTPDNGEVKVDTEAGENAPQMSVTETKEEIVDKMLTDEEKKQVEENGAKIKVTVKIEDLNTTVSEKDKTAVANVLADKTIGQYVDISVYKTIGNNPQAQVTTTKGSIKIAITLPDNLKNKDTTKTRTYGIIRVHDGVAHMLDANYDAATDTLTFESDQFSTYAIVYKDTAVVNGDGTTTTPDDTTPDTPDETPNGGQTVNNSPTTGDNAFTLVLALAALLAASGSVLVFGRKRKCSR